MRQFRNFLRTGFVCTRSSSWWLISKNNWGAWFWKQGSGPPEASETLLEKTVEGKSLNLSVHSGICHLSHSVICTMTLWGIFYKAFKNSFNYQRKSKFSTWHLWWWRDVRSLLGDSRGTGSPPSGWGPKILCLPSWPAWTLGSCGILPIQWRSCSENTEHSEPATFKLQPFQKHTRNDPNHHSVFSHWRALYFWNLKSVIFMSTIFSK